MSCCCCYRFFFFFLPTLCKAISAGVLWNVRKSCRYVADWFLVRGDGIRKLKLWCRDARRETIGSLIFGLEKFQDSKSLHSWFFSVRDRDRDQPTEISVNLGLDTDLGFCVYIICSTLVKFSFSLMHLTNVFRTCWLTLLSTLHLQVIRSNYSESFQG